MHPQQESYWRNVKPIGVRAGYDEGKRCAETLTFDYRRQRGVRARVARIFDTHGPRMHDDENSVRNLICRALHGQPLTICGDGARSLCYVDDVVEGLIRLMGSSDDAVGPVNLGDDRDVTVAELADLVLRLTGSDAVVQRREPVRTNRRAAGPIFVVPSSCPAGRHR